MTDLKTLGDECPKCFFCFDDLGLPVTFHPDILPENCQCKNIMCLQCARDMLNLNKRYDPSQPQYYQCSTCRQYLKVSFSELKRKKAHQLYIKDMEFAKQLDDKYGPIDCPRGCDKKYLRCDSNQHFQECDFVPKDCNLCNQRSVIFNEHKNVCSHVMVQCQYCNHEHKRKDLYNCNYYPIKCMYCNKYYYKYRYNKHVNECDQKKKKCTICGFTTIYMGAHTARCKFCLRPCANCNCINDNSIKYNFYWSIKNKHMKNYKQVKDLMISIKALSIQEAREKLIALFQNQYYIVEEIKNTEPQILPEDVCVSASASSI